MSKYLRLLQECTGLNNAVSPTKIKYDPRTGISGLSIAVNVDIGDDGSIRRREGITATARTEDVHSIFNGKKATYFVYGDRLYSLKEDYSGIFIRENLSLNAPMSYAEVGENVYYGNGFQIGYVKDDINYDWVAGTYIGPTTYKQFSDPPVGYILIHYRGRMYVVADYLLYWSEPFAYNWFDMARNYVWFSDVIIAGTAVDEGIYLSTESRIIFLRGETPDEFSPVTVSTYPAIKGTMIQVSGEELLGGTQGKCVMWTSQNGVYLGTSGGEVKNITDRRLVLPDVSSGCAAYHNGKYITFLRK